MPRTVLAVSVTLAFVVALSTLVWRVAPHGGRWQLSDSRASNSLSERSVPNTPTVEPEADTPDTTLGDGNAEVDRNAEIDVKLGVASPPEGNATSGRLPRALLSARRSFQALAQRREMAHKGRQPQEEAMLTLRMNRLTPRIRVLESGVDPDRTIEVGSVSTGR